MQINARVYSSGAWRGLHSVGIRDSIEAINGIGHAAVVTDPQFRAVLAQHGFSLVAESGEIPQLAPYVGAFSARTAQIRRNVDRYEAEWRTEHPGEEPKAAEVAAAETGAEGHSAAWLIRQHGWGWDNEGHWIRRPDPTPAPGARLEPGDLLLVDEAGMLDQETPPAPCDSASGGLCVDSDGPYAL